jgi:hypothetical protein
MPMAETTALAWDAIFQFSFALSSANTFWFVINHKDYTHGLSFEN